MFQKYYKPEPKFYLFKGIKADEIRSYPKDGLFIADLYLEGKLVHTIRTKAHSIPVIDQTETAYVLQPVKEE